MTGADFRSDTLTTPTQAMRDAMASARVGDDVFGEDPTVKELESLAAEKVGMPAGLFVPSGTMANQIAVKLFTQPGDEIIAEENSHVLTFEAGGIGLISGVQCRPIRSRGGILDPDEIESRIRADDIHLPRTALICLENTHNVAGGVVMPLSVLDRIAELARRHRIPLHLDGARLFNAAVAEGIDPREYGPRVDLLWVALSKGLSAPVGSVICGDEAKIGRCRRIRKVLGGGMRQVGVLAAAGLVALEHGIERLAEDHRRAAALAGGISRLPGARVDLAATRTNIVMVELEQGGADRVVSALLERGVKALVFDDSHIRFVTHREVDDAGVALAVSAMTDVLAAGRGG
ncbi:MAG: GntG family PLP-dependent aldolase [Planctomycetota bacterium]